MQVFQSILQGTFRHGSVTVAGEIRSNQTAASGEKYGNADQGDGDADEEFEPEGMADALLVVGATELGGENTGTGAGTKHAQIEHKQQLVDDGDTAHGNGTHLAHHDVVQQGNKIGNTVLDDNGDGYPKDAAVERPVTDVTLKHRKPLFKYGVWSCFDDCTAGQRGCQEG